MATMRMVHVRERTVAALRLLAGMLLAKAQAAPVASTAFATAGGAADGSQPVLQQR